MLTKFSKKGLDGKMKAILSFSWKEKNHYLFICMKHPRALVRYKSFAEWATKNLIDFLLCYYECFFLLESLTAVRRYLADNIFYDQNF